MKSINRDITRGKILVTRLPTHLVEDDVGGRVEDVLDGGGVHAGVVKPGHKILRV